MGLGPNVVRFTSRKGKVKNKIHVGDYNSYSLELLT